MATGRGITRRAFGTAAALGGLAATGALPLLRVPTARAAGGQVVVGTWGGDYQNLMDKFIAQPLVAPKGYEVVWDTGNDSARKTKLMAEKRLPRGTMDLVALTASGSYEMWTQGTIEELDESKIPNMRNIPPEMKTKYSIPHIFTGRVIVYNPKFVKEAPTSYADLWNPAYAGKVGVIDIQYQTTIESAAMTAGGGLDDYEPGKQKLLDLKKQGVKIFPTNEAMAQALKTEDVWLCIMWKARAVQWQNAGIPVEAANPKEGIVLYVSELVVAKNARNKPGSYAYLDALLDPSPQLEFAKNFGYNPTVSNVTLPEELKARIGFPPQVKFLTQNQEYLAKNDAQLKEWWDKVFKA